MTCFACPSSPHTTLPTHNTIPHIFTYSWLKKKKQMLRNPLLCSGWGF